MAELQTNTSSSQTSTQSPQLAPQFKSSAAPASQVQPGAATQLQNIGKISLQTATPAPTRLSNMPSAEAVADARQSQVTATLPPQREITPVIWALPIALFVIAVAVFWLTNRTSREKYNE